MTTLFDIYRERQSNNIYTSKKTIENEEIDKPQRF